MSAMSYAAADSATMLRRNLRHMLRYPSMTLLLAFMPIVLLLIFVYVFGGTLGSGLGQVPGGGGRAAYISYVVPGVIVLSIACVVQATAISVAMDMTTGIIARFRTMAISRASVLTGHVVATQVQVLFTMALVAGVALAIGFRSNASPGAWLAAIGLLLIVSFALTWLAVALGLVAKTVESASNLPMFLTLLPFLGSGFVPTASMPIGLRWFAQYQPFTPVTEAVRGLLVGGPVAGHAIVSAGWAVGLALVSYLWAKYLYNRGPQLPR
ncbi:MAG TPA: ABC transporter permease [Trebonia sp.]|jgi:ABC-2 type transport system permease protein|nr:ABC transporter permease [Trebonia sp.]